MFDIRVAEGITLSGKLAILWISRKLDEYMNDALKTGPVVHKIHHISRPPETTVEISGGKNYAFYQDTDSVYIDMSALVDKMYTKQQQVEEVEKVVNFLDLLFKKKIEPFINECYKELADYVNADEQRMFMKRENICISAIWTAKKRYTMLVADSEGVRYLPDLYHKTIGLDAVKASYPKFCRAWMMEGYKIALTGTELQMQEFATEKRKEFMRLPVLSIATPTSVNGLDKYHDAVTVSGKGAPKHVKAALWHNHLLNKLKIEGVGRINSGDKILYVELRNPNPYNCECIGFQGNLPTSFKLDKFIDYDTNWEKCFISPMNNLLSSVGWSSTRTASAFEWFS